MSLQRAHHSIIRSVRQQSLVREWFQKRQDKSPRFSGLVFDARFQDAEDVLISRARVTKKVELACVEAGRRIEEANGQYMKGQILSEVLDRRFEALTVPIWLRSLNECVPIYSIMPTTDTDSRPVTLELLALPYSKGSSSPDIIVISFHVFSTEGSFKLAGLLRQAANGKATIWSTIIDITATLPENLQEMYELE